MNLLPESLEYLSIWLVTNGILDDIPVENIPRFEKEYHEYMKRNHTKIMDELSTGQKPSEDLLKKIEKSTRNLKKVLS